MPGRTADAVSAIRKFNGAINMLVYRSTAGLLVADNRQAPCRRLGDITIDALFTASVSAGELRQRFEQSNHDADAPIENYSVLPPIESQEVWAAGVTYIRSRSARMEESATSGAKDFYDLVYHAHRPELFFKATPHRVVGHNHSMLLRGDSKWLVPEPEVTLALNCRGDMIGFTIGNDLSSRDIEGENPLYLPQAKVWDGSAALGPGLFLTNVWPPGETEIELSIRRLGREVFAGRTSLAEMKQSFENLRDHLFRHNSFPRGCYLMTGTGIVPPSEFSLQTGDEVAITVEPVGTLVNVMA